MKSLVLVFVLLIGSVVAFSQDETAPIVEKQMDYNNWEFKKPEGGKVELRKFAAGKKLVLVVYFSAWCHNWRHESPIVLRLYEKYKDRGLDVIGVAGYDSVEATKFDISFKKITFPVVIESQSTGDRLKTTHYQYRTAIGDTRKWGSPLNVFLLPAEFETNGDVLAKRAFVSAGELVEAEAEAFIREKLGLPPVNPTSELIERKKAVEVCDPKATVLKKPRK